MTKDATTTNEITHEELKDLDDFMTIICYDMGLRNSVKLIRDYLGNLCNTMDKLLTLPQYNFDDIIKEYNIVEGN